MRDKQFFVCVPNNIIKIWSLRIIPDVVQMKDVSLALKMSADLGGKTIIMAEFWLSNMVWLKYIKIMKIHCFFNASLLCPDKLWLWIVIYYPINFSTPLILWCISLDLLFSCFHKICMSIWWPSICQECNICSFINL